MAQLSKIVSSILRDMVLAQHEANLYAASLAGSYRKNGKTEKFILPAVALGELEIELHYGVADVSKESEQYEINYPELRKMVSKLAYQLAQTLIDSVITVINSAEEITDIKGLSLIEKLKTDKKTKRKFTSFLSHKLFSYLQLDFATLLEENGKLNTTLLCDTTLKIGEEFLLDNQELEGMFSSDTGEETRAMVKNKMERDINSIVPRLTSNMDIWHKKVLPSLDVIVASEELDNFSEGCIQALRFKVAPQRLQLDQPAVSQEDQL
jgi:hypothetical protein